MKDQRGTNNKEKSQEQSNEMNKSEAEHKLEKQSKTKSLPELLLTEKTLEKSAMAKAVKANMKAVEKSNK